MPQIPQYNAPTTKITESNEGYSAWETAGRRIGPLLNQAAQDATKEGALQAQTIKESAWPLRFLELAKKPTTIAFKVAGGVDNKPWGDQNTTLGQVGVGAANIGDVMDAALGNPDRQTVGPDYGGRTTGGNLPPLDPWGTSGLAKGGPNPNAAAIAAANAYNYGNAKPPVQAPAPAGSQYGYNPDGSNAAPPTPYDNGQGSVIGRIAAGIAGVMGNADPYQGGEMP